MSKKVRLAISISLAVGGFGLSCLSCILPNNMCKEVIFGLGISILTTAIIDIYEYIMKDSKKEDYVKSMGLVDLNYNESSNSQDGIYKHAKKLSIIFNAGVGTFRKYQDTICDSIIQKGCDVKIILSDENILKSGIYTSAINETDTTKRIIENIIDDVSKQTRGGSIELRYSSIPPIGSVEIRDDKYCIVVPYMDKQNSICSYHAMYKNTGNENDIYHKWKKHFDDIWKKAEKNIVLKYSNKDE